MNIIFMGTPDFSIPSLKMLKQSDYNLVAIVTKQDKPKGRGNNIIFSPAKDFGNENNIEVLQPFSMKDKDFIQKLKSFNPDLFITVAFGKLLTKEILEIPKYGCINVHASLLPKLRGASPIHHAIINGYQRTGISTMLTDLGMDTGDILLQSEVEISETMTLIELHDILSELGAKVLETTINQLKNQTLIRTKQVEEEATYAPMISKDFGNINWNSSPQEIYNFVRGTNPWPGAYTIYKGKRMKVWNIEIVDCHQTIWDCGKILKVDKQGLTVAVSEGTIRIKEVQFSSCRRMALGEYICGNKIDEGDLLGK